MDFRDWLQEQKTIHDLDSKLGNWSVEAILSKYDELEKTPFKVGDIVEIQGFGKGKIVSSDKYYAIDKIGTSFFSTFLCQAEELTLLPKTKKVFSLEKYLKLDVDFELRKLSLLNGWPMRCDGKTTEEESVLTNWSDGTDVWVEVEVK